MAPAMGSIYYICSLTLGEVCGGSFNPARSLGPAMIAGQMESSQFINFISPMIGSVLAAIIYNSIFIDNEVDEQENKRIQNEMRNEQRNLTED